MAVQACHSSCSCCPYLLPLLGGGAAAGLTAPPAPCTPPYPPEPLSASDSWAMCSLTWFQYGGLWFSYRTPHFLNLEAFERHVWVPICPLAPALWGSCLTLLSPTSQPPSSSHPEDLPCRLQVPGAARLFQELPKLFGAYNESPITYHS